MTSPATKANRLSNQSRSHFLRWTSWLLLLVIGTIIGLFISQWFAGLLPGPHVEAQLRGLRPQKGNAFGCVLYSLMISNDKSVDYAEIKLQVPHTITDYKVGYTAEAYSSTSGLMYMQAIEMGRQSGGECAIVKTAVNNTIDIDSAASGNMIHIHLSKLTAKSVIIGGIATPDYGSSVNPAELYFEGTYEYTILGQRVKRPVKFTDLGVTDGK